MFIALLLVVLAAFLVVAIVGAIVIALCARHSASGADRWN
jgi:hypothetical protein